MKKKSKVWLTDEQKELLKASEITEIRKEQDTYGRFGAALILTMFCFIMSLVATWLWFGKLAIFFTSGWLLINVIMLMLSVIQFKAYKGAVMKAKKRIESES